MRRFSRAPFVPFTPLAPFEPFVPLAPLLPFVPGSSSAVSVTSALPWRPISVATEGLALAQLAQRRLDGPVFLWHEGADLVLALADQPHRDRLHAPGARA